MIMTNNEELYEKLLYLRTHGITRESKFMKGNPDGPWYYEQIGLGMNYRITDIQASLGISQLTHLDEFISRRHELAKRYNEALSDLPITTPYMHPETYSAFHLYVIRLKLNEINKTRKEVFELLRKKGISVNVHYIPVHIQPYYKKQGFEYGLYPEAENYYEAAITLPLYPSMTEMEQNRVIESLYESLK
jgi:dTDP-4-amino-4,6-dideoxygalactose transaminase